VRRRFLHDDADDRQDHHVPSALLLKGVDRVLPPADYRVVTDEELIEGLSFVAYRRVSTVIFVPAPSGAAVEMVTSILWSLRPRRTRMQPCMKFTPPIGCHLKKLPGPFGTASRLLRAAAPARLVPLIEQR
jgi:hypothetical protein